jgi:gamma-glutamylcyclotransferase (GGCT)/AIG2-like uncharacterized protein YtfP
VARGNVKHVFFYGTLCAGQAAHRRLGLRGRLVPLGERIVRGALFDLGPFPGLVLGAGETRAQLYRFKDRGVLERLDRYEGFDPARPSASPFLRTTVRAPRFASTPAPTLEAWIYVYNGSVTGRARIPGGYWIDYQQSRARRSSPG